MEEFKETEPVSTLPDSLPVENPVLQRQDAVEVQEVVPVVEPKKKRVLSEAQKENLKLGRAIARKNREEKAKAKLDQMVDNYLKPFANKDEEETEPVKEEEKEMPPPPPVPQLKKKQKDTTYQSLLNVRRQCRRECTTNTTGLFRRIRRMAHSTHKETQAIMESSSHYGESNDYACTF